MKEKTRRIARLEPLVGRGKKRQIRQHPQRMFDQERKEPASDSKIIPFKRPVDDDPTDPAA